MFEKSEEKEQEKEKKSHMGLWIGLAVFLLLVLLVLSVQVRTVTVTGNNKYSAEQIEDMLFENRWDRNSLFLFLKDRVRPHK